VREKEAPRDAPFPAHARPLSRFVQRLVNNMTATVRELAAAATVKTSSSRSPGRARLSLDIGV
jgi:hypothetical protein